MSDRELIQQLRDALKAAVKDDRSSAIVWFYSFKAAHELITAADARLAEPEWTRVTDAVPVIPDNKVSVDVWLWFAGKEPYRWPFSRYADMLDSRVTHWQYVVEPQPPEQQP